MSQLTDQVWKGEREHLVRCLSRLGSWTAQTVLVVAQPELDCQELRALGFQSCCSEPELDTLSNDELDGRTAQAACILVASTGSDHSMALKCVWRLCGSENMPPVVPVLARPGPEDRAARPAAMLARSELFEAGADDVISLYGAETLTVARMQQLIQWTEVTARKAMERIQADSEEAKSQAVTTLRIARKKFIWDLPGKVLQHVPFAEENTDDAIASMGYVVKSELGSGSFGAVLTAEHPQKGVHAIKVIKKSNIDDAQQLISWESELSIMLNLPPHPHVVTGHAAMHTKSSIFMVMDFAGELNLSDYVSNRLKDTGQPLLPRNLIESFCEQEASAVAYLHSCWVCHRDIKPANFIVTKSDVLCLADFGLSVALRGPEQDLRDCCGSLPFAAPEVLRMRLAEDPHQEGYRGLPADVWSLGAAFLELACGIYSLERLLGWLPSHPTDMMKQLLDTERLEAIWLTEPQEVCVPGLRNIIENMLCLQPDRRWSLNRVAKELRPEEDGSAPAAGACPLEFAAAGARAAGPAPSR